MIPIIPNFVSMKDNMVIKTNSNIREVEGNDHQRAIRYILPIFVPSFAEFWAKCIDFSFCRPELALCKSGLVSLQTTGSELVRTPIHCIGSKQLIVVCDSLCDVESSVCEPVDAFSWVQASPV